MRRSLAAGVMLCAVLSAGPAAAQEVRQAGPVLVHTGACEPSGAVALPEGDLGGRIIVADDDDNVLRSYAAGSGGGPDPNFTGEGVIGGDAKADLEGAAWLGGRIYWIGSHSRNNPQGEVRAARQRLIATEARPDGGPGLRPVGTSTGLLDALAAHDRFLKRAIGDSGKKPSLAPENDEAGKGGLNIEGLAAGRDGQSLLIGLRGPLTRGSRAVLVSLENPAAVVTGQPPRLGPLVRLSLGGRGVRSLEYLPVRGLYVISAGPAGSKGAFGLYTWSGQAGDKAVPLAGSEALLRRLSEREGGRFSPEAMVADAAGRHLLLLSDDGDLKTVGNTKCKDLEAGNPGRRFRSVLISLD